MPANEPDPDHAGRVTLLLDRASAGDHQAARDLLPLVYDELRKVARWRMAREPAGHTLQATALVHEAYLRLLGGDDQSLEKWENRRHFFAAAAEAMRRILIERARRYSRLRHGGGQERQDLDIAETVRAGADAEADLDELLTLDTALDRLEEHDADMATLVKLKHYAGFETSEIVEALGLSERTVHRKWSAARAWLKRELSISRSRTSR